MHVVLNLLSLEAAAQVISVVHVKLNLTIRPLVFVSNLLIVIVNINVFIRSITVHLIASNYVVDYLARLSIVAIFKCVIASPRLIAVLLITVIVVNILVLVRVLHINHLVAIFNHIIVILISGHGILHFIAHLDAALLFKLFSFQIQN